MVDNSQSEEFSEIQAAASILGDLLARDASFERHIREIIDRGLAKGVTVETYGELGRRLTEYVGESAARFLMRFNHEEYPEPLLEPVLALEEFEKRDDLVLFLRRLRALYGETAQTAYALWREDPDNWRAVNCKLDYDEMAKAWALHITIRKYNGEVMAIKTDPSGLILLVHYLLEHLNRLPEPRAIPQFRLEDFAKVLDTFKEKFMQKED